LSDRPWGPHGPEVPPNTVRPNPTAPGPLQQFGGADEAPTPTSAGGGGSGLGGVLANIVISLVLVALLWIPMVCLYPLSALSGAAAGFGTFPIFARVLPPDGRDVAAVLGIALGAITVFVMYRIELRLAERPAFRAARHVVRLVLLAVWAIPIIQLAMGATAPTTSTRYILAVVSSPAALAAFLKRPRNLVLWVAAVAGLHFLLWSGQGIRRWWHRRLLFVGLR
jgi:hypothetical protein